jgi:hydrogenase expression/formation protein HypC
MCLGIPGRITEIRRDGALAMGVVDFGGVRREVCLAYVADEVEVGDYAIVHVGFAISRVDEDEARRTFEILREMSQLDELEWIKEVADQAESVDVPGVQDESQPLGGPGSPGDGDNP